MNELKVTASLGFRPEQMQITAEGVKFDENFVEEMYLKEEYFRERIIIKINEAVGNDWKVYFIDYRAPNRNKFIVEIKVPDAEYYSQVIGIISDSFPEIDLLFWQMGNMRTGNLGHTRGWFV
jgi:hypothetical protein